MVSMICGFNSTKNAKGGTQDGIIHPDGQSTANCTIDSAISLESFELEILPTRGPVQPRLLYLDHSHLVWR
jgi:hypothetical protein